MKKKQQKPVRWTKRRIGRIRRSDGLRPKCVDAFTMGVNRCAFGIIDDAVVRKAAEQEIIRRYLHSASDYVQGLGTKETEERSKEIMKDAIKVCVMAVW